MKKILQLLFLSAIILFLNQDRIDAQNKITQNGIKYSGKVPEVIIYESGKVEQFYIKAQNRKKAGEEPTATFEVTYNGFSDDAKTAFAKAVELWSYLIKSSVTINIDATWQALDAGVLGSAGPNSLRREFKNAPVSLTWYPIAIANKLASFDLEPESFDIRARFSSTMNWYLGVDGNCPANQYDFVSIVMHEIGHGLGFTGSADVDGTNGSWGLYDFPYIYDRFVFNESDELLIDTLTFTNPSTQLKDEYTSGEVYFQSELSDQANGGGHAELYAPSVWNDGSSYSHLDDVFNGTEHSMMTYSSGTGEVTHDPGDITLGMFAEMGWTNVLYKHFIIKDIEAMTTPVTVETKIYSDSSLVDGSVILHYSDDNFDTENTVVMTSSNDTLFTAEIPVLATDTVKYYFEASTTLSRTYYYPVQGKLPVTTIDTTLYFKIGTDTEEPVLSHSPTNSIFNFDEELILNIGADDNLGIDSVHVEYKLNDGELKYQKCDSIEFAEIDNLYLYQTSFSITDMLDGDTLSYRIVAVDLASTPNKKTLPASDFYKVAILDLNEATEDITINFDESSDAGLLVQDGLSVSQPNGFSSQGLHSPHPYEEGDPYPNNEIIYSAMLKTPIILKDNDSYIRFDEIVIVEPGSAGTNYGDDEFWDYVIVEGSKDTAKTWFAFEDGYDCDISSTFRNVYNTNGDGTESMYLSHMINLLGNSNLVGGDEVLIRFRLWSDQLTVGWGWAIDNVEIQGNVTSIDKKTLMSENLKVFPSPSNGHFDILLNSEEQIKEYTVLIFNAAGKVIYKETRNESNNNIKHHIDISNNAPGIYLLRVNTGNKSISKKILIN